MISVFERIELIHEIAYKVAREIIAEMGCYGERVEQYLQELQQISLMRKQDPLEADRPQLATFHYDFKWLADRYFIGDFEAGYRPEGIELEVCHTADQATLIDSYVKQYGKDIIGLSRVVLRANMNRLYRSVHYATSVEQERAA